MLVLSLFLLAFFEYGFCKCLITTNITKPNNNVTILSTVCEMGNCIENKCVCHKGWMGDLCDSCEGRILLNDSSGFVFDGPQNYSHQTKCSWLIQPSVPHTSLRLIFNEFSTECGWDYLFIYDGDSSFSPLIGSFNGILYTPGLTNRLKPEIIAKSGTAFLHFYSDVAYHAIGFNISYSVDQCQYNCFNQGNCSDGECECQDTRDGQTCNICPSNCTGSDTSFVECLEEDLLTCDRPNTDGLWSVEEFNASILAARASASVALHNNSLWVYGGLQFGPQIQPSGSLPVFDTSNKSWKLHEPALSQHVTPAARYGHTIVAWSNKLIVFGGKLVESETVVNEMWEYDLLLSEWEPVMYSADFGGSVTNDSGSWSQLKLSGHTANLIRFSNGSEIMVVLFGYHPAMVVSRFIYEYNPQTKLWRMPLPSGSLIPGLFGHTTAYDSSSNLVYIHGGYASSRGTTTLLSSTFLYDPVNRYFSALKPSGIKRSLHSANFVNGLMYVYGGNTHSDSFESKGALCFSSNFMAYHAACDRWLKIPSPPNSLYPHRYGHRSVVVNSNEKGADLIYIFSGYDSTLITNMLIYQPPSCANFNDNESMCLDKFEATVHNTPCYWNGTDCLMKNICPTTLGFDWCTYLYSSCRDCVSSSHGCSYCSSKCVRTSQDCNNKTCESETVSFCRSLLNCEQCEAASAHCKWDQGCFAKEIVPSDVSSTCNTRLECGSATTCDACGRRQDCMWCLKPELCFPISAYLLNFPYGQCVEWSTGRSCSTYNCSFHKSCEKCHNYTNCGWCDDGTLKGLGRCVDGAGSGAVVFNTTTKRYEVDNETCPSSSWYFTSCPNCQCNGHSTCNAKGECAHCLDNTEGPQCNVCSGGFFGDPMNGGTCSECQCEGKAVTCRPNGKCNCFTKGEIGRTCELCNKDRSYVGDATGNGTCYYPLSEDFAFTFNLFPPADVHVTAINFQSTPDMAEDVLMSFSSVISCNLRLAVISATTLTISNSEITLRELTDIRTATYTFSNRNFNFGGETNSTIRIYVSNFSTPNTIKVSLLQRNNVLLTILLILFSSFLVVLFVSAGIWKLKLLYDSHRHRAQRAIQMKKMAARPFASVDLCCEVTDRATHRLLAPGRSNRELPEVTPQAFCEEECGDSKVAVVSVFLWLPSDLTIDSDPEGPDCSNTRNSETLACSYVTPPPGQAALGIGSALSSGRRVKTHFWTPKPKRKGIEVFDNFQTDEFTSVVHETATVGAYDNPAMQMSQI